MSDTAFILYLVLLGILSAGVLALLISLVWVSHREYMDSRRRADEAWERLRRRLT